MEALYALHEGRYLPHIFGAPDFVNRPFTQRYPDGLPPLTPLAVRSDPPPATASGAGN